MAEKQTLTPAQKMAVENEGGKLLVSAAAGSGKTKVLVDRLLRYVTAPENPANLDDFLIITYTKAAASELRSKIADKLSERIAENPGNLHLQHQVQRLYLTPISTVHSFCSDLLRRYAYLVDVPMDFRVADEIENDELRQAAVDAVLERAYADIENNENFRAFADTQGLGRSDKTVPEILLKIYEASRCHLNPNQWLMDCVSQSQLDETQDISETLWGKYLTDCFLEKLDLSISAMENCLREADRIPEFSKVSAVLTADIEMMKKIRSAQNWDALVEGANFAFGRMTFPTKNNPDPELTAQIKAVREACKERMKEESAVFSETRERVEADLRGVQKAVCGLVELVREFEKTYQSMKANRRILDFSDLEHRTLDLLLGKKRDHITAAAKEIGASFREILVDEYQDSNGVQDAIFAALTEEKQNCFMVGDVKQSIYRFRLANPNIFLQKYETYQNAETAENGQGRKIHLSSNFRSGEGVVSAVNHVFRYCMSQRLGGMDYGPDEELIEGVPHVKLYPLVKSGEGYFVDESKPEEPETELFCIQVGNRTYSTEAAFVADRIVQLLDGTHGVRSKDGLRPILPEDIVILLRSPGSVGHIYQQALEERGIPCYSGNGDNLLKAEEIEVLRNLLETISNPRQDIPLLAVLASPLFGFTADDLATIRSGRTHCTFYEAMIQSGTEKSVRFLALLHDMREYARLCSLSELLQMLYSSTHIESIYGMRADGELRKSNLRLFFEMAIDFESSRQRGAEDFLEYLRGLDEKGVHVVPEQAGAGCVTIMSIHKSKGLEFPVVFLCGLSKAFNREDSKGRVQCDQNLGIGASIVDDRLRIYYPSVPLRAIKRKEERESLWEELRVLYVAMTRAKDRLIMTYTSQYLSNTLVRFCSRLKIEGKDLLLQEVKSMGDWVLLAALQKLEAGALFAIGGKHHEASAKGKPWYIEYLVASEENSQQTASASVTITPEQATEQHEDYAWLREGLQFAYPHLAATREPSKQTATQLKGRAKDEESEEDSFIPNKKTLVWRHFADSEKSGTEYGNAMHKIMQNISLDSCSDYLAVRREIIRMEDAGILTQEQGDICNPKQIAAFFQTEIGKAVINSDNIQREFKFSILRSPDEESLKEEAVLLQGVVDCFYMDETGITIVDFKTDSVTEETLPGKVTEYSPQVNAYASALERIFRLPVKQKYLYFFRMNHLAKV